MMLYNKVEKKEESEIKAKKALTLKNR